MELEIYRDQNKKGLGTSDLFNVIPVGKKDDRVVVPIEGKLNMIFEWGESISDGDIRAAIIMLSFSLHSWGKSKIDKLRNGVQLEEFNEKGQATYTNSLSVKGVDISAFMNKGDKKKAKRIYQSLKNIEKLNIDYEEPGLSTRIRLFSRVAYKNGYLTFDIANFLLNRIGQTLVAFRTAPIVDSRGRTIRLALYVETHQRGAGSYIKDGEKHTKYVPLNEYYIDDLIIGLNLNPKVQISRTISRLQEDFNALKIINPGFPQFTYNSRRRSFENEHKNGIKSRRIS